MDWITDEVAIGNYLEAQDAALLMQHAFRSVVSLDGTLSAREIAQRMGVGKSAVTMRLERFRARVRRELCERLARSA